MARMARATIEQYAHVTIRTDDGDDLDLETVKRLACLLLRRRYPDQHFDLDDAYRNAHNSVTVVFQGDYSSEEGAV